MLILGLGDLIAASLLVSQAYAVQVSSILIIILAAYLFLKGLLFFMDLGSLMDIFGGIVLVLSLSSQVPEPLLLGAAGLLGLKGTMSLFGRIF